VRLLFLIFLLPLACGPPPRRTPLERAQAAAGARGVPVLALFAGQGLALGDRLREAVKGDGRLPALAELVELDPVADGALFERAMGSRGRLGLVWLSGEGEVLSVIPGFAPPLDVLARARLVKRRSAAARDDLLALQLALRAFAPAEAGLRSRLAKGDEPEQRARLAYCLVRRGAIAEGRAELRRALVSRPELAGQPSVVLTRALAHIAGREPRAALELLEGGPQGDEYLLALGIARHHAEDPAGLAPLGDLVERYPLSPWLPEARRQIEHILSPPPEHDHR
jgi:hypothetical protein